MLYVIFGALVLGAIIGLTWDHTYNWTRRNRWAIEKRGYRFKR